MANFETYYSKLISAEGGYVNDPEDRGGETYRGISRKNFPNWGGWNVVDRAKLTKGQILPSLEPLVKSFYKNRFWVSIFADQIKNQSIAEIIADWKVNGGLNIKSIQKIVKVKPDGVLGVDTVQAINEANPKVLFDQIKTARQAHYDKIVLNDPTQKKFYDGWKNRLDKFQFLPFASLGISTLIVGAWIIYLILDSKKTLI